MNIVVLDGGELAPGVDFPPLDAQKYGWMQYTRLGYGEIAPTCWRSNVVITFATSLDAPCLAELKCIQLLITGREAGTLADRELLRQRGIELVEFTDVDWKDPAQADHGCRRIVATIDAFLRQRR